MSARDQPVSFWLDGLNELRLLHGKLVEAGVKPITPIDHGLGLEPLLPRSRGQNNLEAFRGTPWYIEQPSPSASTFRGTTTG